MSIGENSLRILWGNTLMIVMINDSLKKFPSNPILNFFFSAIAKGIPWVFSGDIPCGITDVIPWGIPKKIS